MKLTPVIKAGYVKEFQTHLNYARCMVGMMYEVKLAVPINKSVDINLSDVRRFTKLANLTKVSIEGEVDGCRSEPEYVQIVAPWFAVKCYYRAYYLESVLIHLSSGTSRPFGNSGHRYVRESIRTYCKNGYVSTKLRHAEVVESYMTAVAHTNTSGANIRKDYFMTEECVKSVRRKLAKYSVEHWKRNSAHKSFRLKAAKQDLAFYVSRGEVCLFDFFYQMRVKANYRDSDFLDFDKILPSEGVEYILHLKRATDRYCSSLEMAIETILHERSLVL